MKKHLCLIFCIAMCLLLPPIATHAASTKPQGSGTEASPYLITSADELFYIAEEINSSSTGTTPTLYAKLQNDIIINDGTFTADGTFTKTGETSASEPIAWTPTKKATIIFDGNNKSISGLYITETAPGSTQYAGLFGYTYQGSKIKNLTIKNSFLSVPYNSSHHHFVGIFAGQSYSTSFTGCTGENNIIKVNGNNYTEKGGGICGDASYCSFNHVSSSGGSISGSGMLAGICSWPSHSTFKNCWNFTTVSNANTLLNVSGGIAAETSSSNFYNCANLANISGGTYTGGICGNTNTVTVKACYSLNNISGNNVYNGVAVLIGNDNDAAVSYCFTQSGSELYDIGGESDSYVNHFDINDLDALKNSLNDSLYKLDGEADLSLWEIGADGYPLPTGDIFVDTSTYYDLWLNGKRVGERNKGDIFDDGLASFDNITNTLTLHDGIVLTKSDSNKHSLLLTGDTIPDLTIVVDGTVKFNSSPNVGSGPCVIQLGSASGSGNLIFKAADGKSAVVEVTDDYALYGISAHSLTLDGDVTLTINTRASCIVVGNYLGLTFTSPNAALDCIVADGEYPPIWNYIQPTLTLPSTNPQKLYEGDRDTALTNVASFTTSRKEGKYPKNFMYPHIRIAPEVYGAADALPSSFTVPMSDANSESALKTWVSNYLNNENITADSITISAVTSAAAGKYSNPDGTNGSFTAEIKLTKNGISLTKTIPGTITATPYAQPEITTSFKSGTLSSDGTFTAGTDNTFTYGDALVFAATYIENGTNITELSGNVSFNDQTYTLTWNAQNSCYLTEALTCPPANTYQALFKLSASEHAEKSGNITVTAIAKTPTAADFTFTAPTDLIYDGNSTAANSLFGYSSEMGDVTVNAYLNGSDAASVCEPGVYTFKLDVPGNQYYSTASITDSAWTFTITKLTASAITEPQAQGSLTYNTEAQQLVTSGSTTTGAIMYCLGNYSDLTDFSAAVPTAKAAGSYTVYWYVKGDRTHADSSIKKIENIIIAQKNIADISISPSESTYSGTGLTPELNMTFGNDTLICNTDYTVSEISNGGGSVSSIIDVGTYTLTIGGINNYFGTNVAQVIVTPKAISAGDITVSLKSDLVYTGQELDPLTAITSSGSALTKGTDFTISYAPKSTSASIGEHGLPKNAGDYTVTITGMGNYSGIRTENVSVSPKSISDTDVSLNITTIVVYADTGIDAEPTLKFGEHMLSNSVDYTVTYAPADSSSSATLDADGLPKNAGDYTVTIAGIGNYSGTKASTITIEPKNIADADVTVKINEKYRFTSNEIDPAPILTAFGRTLGTDDGYTVSYAPKSGSPADYLGANGLPKEIGEYTATITGNSNFTGIVTFNFKVARNSSGSHEHSYGSWQYSSVEHWRECTVDGAVGDRAAHTDSDNNGKCDICGYTVSAAGSTFPFSDVKPKDWFYDDVKYVYENGLMNGTGTDIFTPKGDTTRAMIITILYRLSGSPEVTVENSFEDVPPNKWYSDAVSWGAQNGIITGYSANKFGPNDKITREQFVAVLYRYAQYMGCNADNPNTSLSDYQDAEKVSAYAANAMQWAISEGIVNGKGNALEPAEHATRAEAASLIHRLCIYIGK